MFLQRLCSEHFEEGQFTSKDKDRLIWKAVPTLFKGLSRPPQRLESTRRTLKWKEASPPKAHKVGSQYVNMN